MKHTLFLLLLFCAALVVKGQDAMKIVDLVKNKRSDLLMQHCIFPFDLSAGTQLDDNHIKEQGTLKLKFDKLFKQKYFDLFFKENKVLQENNTVIFEIHSYNDKKELESESSILFNFKKGKDGKLKLFQIMMAG